MARCHLSNRYILTTAGIHQLVSRTKPHRPKQMIDYPRRPRHHFGSREVAGRIVGGKCVSAVSDYGGYYGFVLSSQAFYCASAALRDVARV